MTPELPGHINSWDLIGVELQNRERETEEAVETNGALKIYARTWLLLILADAALLSVSVWMLFVTPVSVLDRTMAIIGTAFFGLGFVVILRFAFRPVLVLDEMGIIDRASGTSVGRVAWSNIREVQPVTFLGRSYLGIVPVSLDLVMESCGAYTKLAMKRRIKMGYPPIVIPSHILGLNSSQLLGQIQEFQKRFQQLSR